MARILKHFRCEHLPQHLQDVSVQICTAASEMDDLLHEGPEKSAGLRFLLQAKDCFVRQRLEDLDDSPSKEKGQGVYDTALQENHDMLGLIGLVISKLSRSSRHPSAIGEAYDLLINYVNRRKEITNGQDSTTQEA